jgi:type VI secretion system protein ImpC
MKKDPRSEVRLSADVASERWEEDRDRQDTPFVIVVLGDFRGAGEGGPAKQTGPLGKRKLESIERDNFDSVLTRFDVWWEGSTAAAAGQSAMQIRIPIRSLDDFHPDRIVQQVAPLRMLLETRKALQDPKRFESVAAEVAKWAKYEPAPEAPSQSPRAALPPNVAPAELLNMILGADAPSRPVPGDSWARDFQSFLRDAVRPHLIQVDSAKQHKLTDAVDAELSRQVRAILQDPEFKRLEASWRSLSWLAAVSETGPDLKVLLVQATKQELLQDLFNHETADQSGLSELLVESSAVAGAIRPSFLVGNYAFSGELEDLALLERMGSIARQLRAPFVAAAHPALLGLSSFAEIPTRFEAETRIGAPERQSWHALRQSPAARYLGLALPHVLCRLPYGARTDTVESFDFEEGDPVGHGCLLWGNPAFRVAGVIASAFSADGWNLDLAQGVARLDGLPLYSYKLDGETRNQPCAEVLMTEWTVESLEQSGMIPLVSYQNSDIVALPCVQAIAEPRVPISFG